MPKMTRSTRILLVLWVTAADALSLSQFHGRSLAIKTNLRKSGCASLTMRKQKASFKRTRRMQRGESLDSIANDLAKPIETMTNSPMSGKSWGHKRAPIRPRQEEKGGGRSRSRKRSNLYNALSKYHQRFLHELTAEYKAEEGEIIGRLEAAREDPLGLEAGGHALFDMYPERRGNLFSDEVYRLVKSHDATTVYKKNDGKEGGDESQVEQSFLPPNCKFSSNDVVLVTLQPDGSGDFFHSSSDPTSKKSTSVEARVLNVGPYYIDVAISGGAFESAFGPAPNNRGESGKGDAGMRLRMDRFFSSVPYDRMIAALGKITAIPHRANVGNSIGDTESPISGIHLDDLFRETIISSFMEDDTEDPMMERDMDLQLIARQLARSPLPNSSKLANEVLRYIQSNPQGVFRQFNAPQLSAIGAALTRRLTMIQGPPGTGKTTVAAAVAFGFVHQCRNISPHTKVLATAFSNVGADNLATALMNVGLNVVRLGKASAISHSLWNNTLDAAIDRDPLAQKAMEKAASATSQLSKKSLKSSSLSERTLREAATAAVKASNEACNVAATKALREADVIVSTSTGAADRRLLAACGIVSEEEQEDDIGKQRSALRKGLKSEGSNTGRKSRAPDNLPLLSLPFVIVDEACQSPEPATLIPLTSTDSCRALVLLGDPCQLPPTVKSCPNSMLSISLMERLSSKLPQPVIVTAQNDRSEKETAFLEAKPTKQALSLLRALDPEAQRCSYRKRFAGSIMLSVQYRMHPSISAFPSALFYDSLLATPKILGDFRIFPQQLEGVLPALGCGVNVRFIDIGGQQNEKRGAVNRFSRTVYGSSASMESEEQSTYQNDAEANRIVSLLKGMLQDEATKSRTIGLVTPYSGQVSLLREKMVADDALQSLSKNLTEPIEINSVDGYQGRERDIIIFSAVRSNRQGNVGFLADWRRLNVALTRARSALVLVGDLETLKSNRHWAALVKWCSGVNCIVE